MSVTPRELFYTRTHEWVRIEGDQATIGVTKQGQSLCGNVILIKLPRKGARFEARSAFATMEGTLAVTEVHMPVSGVVIDVNGALPAKTSSIDEDPYGGGWMITVKVTKPVSGLLDAVEYDDYLRSGASA